MSLPYVPSTSRAALLAGRISSFGRSHSGFRIGYRTASATCVIALAWALVAAWRHDAARVPVLFGIAPAFDATVSVVVLLLAGVALRMARRRETKRMGLRTGLVRGAVTALAREAEVATGLVASLIAGAAVASSPAACEAIAGWFAPAFGLSTAGWATSTMLIVGAIGTVTTELARRGISRSLEQA